MADTLGATIYESLKSTRTNLGYFNYQQIQLLKAVRDEKELHHFLVSTRLNHRVEIVDDLDETVRNITAAIEARTEKQQFFLVFLYSPVLALYIAVCNWLAKKDGPEQ